MRVAHYIADDFERSKAFIAYIALCRKGKRWRAGACIHVPRSFTVAAISVIDGSSPGQSEIITALSDIKKGSIIKVGVRNKKADKASPIR